MKYTLLDMVQDILSDMDSDSVNSIWDTIESEQVATIVKSTFYSMLSTRDWPHTKKLIQLTPSADPALPTHMTVPSEVTRVVFINYDSAKAGEDRRKYSKVVWREPQEFLQLANQLDSTQDSVDIIQDSSGVELLIRNNTYPTYYTSFDDETLIFNAYDKEVDDTLQNDKVQCQAYVTPPWLMEDSFVPDLPSEAFMALLEEAKSRAMFRLKQMEDPKAEEESRRQQRWLSRNAWKVKGGIKKPNYGRNSRKMHRDSTFNRS